MKIATILSPCDFSPVLSQLGTSLRRSLLCVSLGFGVGIGSFGAVDRAWAQSISSDGTTGTQVQQLGNEYRITGGVQAGDNLFHGFEQFGLNSGQVANFVGSPELVNILGRISSGDPSVINGLLRVSNSSANLFLMNPAGLVFGPDAQLDLSGSFTATTATGIGFESGVFNAFGSNDYASLVGSPNAFEFEAVAGGSLVNFGELAVPTGEDLVLLGGTVLNLGQVSAPGGRVLLGTVPEGQRVRLLQEGMVLGLEVEPLTAGLAFTALNLPGLLTYSGVDHASVLTVGADGTVTLSGSGLSVEAGDLVVGSVVAGSGLGLSAGDLLSGPGRLETTGDLRLQADGVVRLRDSEVEPFQVLAGGDLWIQGRETVDILALNHLVLGVPFQARGDLTLVSDGPISADSHFASRGSFSLEMLDGSAGDFISFYDPIITASGDVTFGAYTGVSLKIEAGGSIFGTGSIVITGPDDPALVPVTDPDFSTLTGGAALILRA